MPKRTIATSLCMLVAACSNSSELATTADHLASADKALSLRIKSQAQDWDAKRVARLPQTGADEWTIGVGDAPQIGLVHQNARAAKLEIDGKRAEYRDLFESTDAIVMRGLGFVEEFLVLKDERAPSEFSWGVRLPAALMSVRADGHGGLEFVDAHGQPHLRMLRPFVLDAGGARRDASLHSKHGVITLKVNIAGLSFPILIDPIVEGVAWVEDRHLTRRSGSAMASLGGKLVLFGGLDVGPDGSGDTWQWDGIQWTQLHPEHAPSPRYGAAAASLGGSVILFGGSSGVNGPSESDTWTWDGSDWMQLQPNTVPPARSSSGLATLGSKVVMFGGLGNDKQLNDTWEWDGNDWSQLTPAASPSPRSAFALAGVGDKAVLFGGYHDGGTVGQLLDDTWEWDGFAWSERAQGSGPPARSYAGAASTGAKMVVYGGLPENAPLAVLDDTWEWDGSGWQQRFPSRNPGARSFSAMTSLGTELLLFGGNSASFEMGDTWIWDGSDWSQVAAPVTPPAATQNATGLGDSLIEFGGGGGDYSNETWVWQNNAWANKTSTVSPSPRGGVPMAPLNGEAVLFGGLDASGKLDDTWEWDGTAWTQLFPATSPGPWWNSCAASFEGKIYLLGGSGHVPSGEIWEWDGTTWTQSLAKPAPTGCSATAVVGSKLLVVSGNVWEWDGAAWVEDKNSALPAASSADCAAASGDKLLYYRNNFTSKLSETWEWDGAAWTQMSMLAGPMAAQGACSMASLSDGVVLFGNGSQDVWKYQTIRLGGSDCIDSATCLSGFCVDGYCCDTLCAKQCEACNIPGKEGMCSPVAGATPSGKSACASDGSLCGGACDGVHRECAYPGTARNCGAASCSADIATLAAFCDGAGSCLPATKQPCAHHCNGTVCADGAVDGARCANDGDCVSGFCTDGLCCNERCSGQCEACNQAGSLGTCVAAQGTPVGSRAPCGSDGSTCGKSCNGGYRDMCVYPGHWVVCGIPFCAYESMTTEGTCDGVGNCAAGAEIACAPYACAGDVCGSTCTADNECAKGNHCSNGVCVSGHVRGAACVLDSDCTSRHCADDVCCDTACDGQCEACAVSGSIGVCTQIAGAPMGSRSPCASGAACQDGTCTKPVKPTSGGGCSCGSTSSLPMLWLCAGSLGALLGRRRRAR